MKPNTEKELAYRYDLFVSPDWRDRFDRLVNESVERPAEGRILDVNSGTGSYAIEMAEGLRGKGEVIGIDPSAERVELAQAKALVKKTQGVHFEVGQGADLRFAGDEFDLVVCDASMTPAGECKALIAEMVCVARPDARVIIKMTTHGSFDEFFSLYWEALVREGLIEEAWARLEALINERPTISAAEEMAAEVGLKNVESFTSKEEFFFDTAKEFFESPLIQDEFLDGWLSILPPADRPRIVAQLTALIDEERHNAPFDLSVKATVITGIKA